MKLTITIIAAALTLSACAKSPDSIAPVSMTGAFNAVSCNTASQMLNAERPILADLQQRQRNAVAGDAVGVFLIGIPVSSLTGNDRAGQIAAAMGKVTALEQRLLSC